jgi:hypothetical protein
MSVCTSARTVAECGSLSDEAHLADIVAGLQDRQDDLTAAGVGGEHAGAAGQQDVERVGLLPCSTTIRRAGSDA